MAARSLLVLACVVAAVVAQKVIDLSGSGWSLQNLPMNISIPASLPSQAHLDLYEQSIIGDPYAADLFP